MLGRMASTMMAGEPAAMKVDATLSDLLAEPAKIELAPGADPVLRLVTASQATLSFLGRMTPEARYGAPTRIFLEVAAPTVACTHRPAARAIACRCASGVSTHKAWPSARRGVAALLRTHRGLHRTSPACATCCD
ncbi:MAG: hypothetical protein IPK42_05890 [Betaproteobacteria bacterium]|nr:hypothetical protein [Betaproteobacteria bacterium]